MKNNMAEIVNVNLAVIDNTNYNNSGNIINVGAVHNLGSIDVSGITGKTLALLDVKTNNNVFLSSNNDLSIDYATSIGSRNSINTSNTSIDFNGHNSTLVLECSGTLGSILDPSSTGIIHIKPNNNITLNGPCGTHEQPLGSIVIDANSSVTLAYHLYVNVLTLAEGASIVPPEMVHIMGDIDTTL